jgi:AraC-like DNA-binding protein
MPDEFSFSSAAGLEQLRTRAQLDSWVAVHESFFWSMDFVQPDDGRFSGEVRAFALGHVGVAHIEASFASGDRQRAHILRDNRDNYALSINDADGPIGVLHGGHETEIEPGGAVLLSGVEPFRFSGNTDKNCINIALPREILLGVSRHVDNRLGARIARGTEALGLLRRYCGLLRIGGPLRDPELQAHAAATVTDLLAIVTGTHGEMAQLAEQRGVRAARLASVLEQIRVAYTHPGISAELVGRTLGISARYVQDLLAETGVGFAERVLEARLQFVRRRLQERGATATRISDIAYAAGFNDISYFNRSFRRRFGMTPGSLR